MLDAILCPEWEYRYYSFNCNWAPGEQMASMRDGCGDDWFLHFNSVGAALKGFAHELAEGKSFGATIQAQVPCEFSAFLNEPAFSMQDATFCFWRKADDSIWQKVQGSLTEDGSDKMLAVLIAGPAGYAAWAEAYYEVAVSIQAVTAVFEHVPLTDETIRMLNPDANLDFTYGEAAEIGYPRHAA
ncbi:hypothetical protein ABT364_23625 [Massilia sp. SR12]